MEKLVKSPWVNVCFGGFSTYGTSVYYVATVLARFAYLLPKPAIYVLLLAVLETRQQLLAKFSRLMALCVQGAQAAVKSLDFLLIEIPEHYIAVHCRGAILC